MRILVTGGAGFIGSHIVETYRAAGHEVSVVDDLSSGRRHNVPPGVPFYQTDIREAEALKRVFQTQKPELVNHHAAQIDVRRSMADPGLDADVNILGTIRLLECCRDQGTRKVIFASTGGAIYGDASENPVAETYLPTPLAPYGVAKFCAEQYLSFYERSYGVAYCALRYANVYGPRQDPFGEAGVVAIFLRRMLSGESPTIYGDGEQTRDFVFAEDVALASLLAAREGCTGVYNVGTGRQTSVNTLYAALAEIVGFEGQPKRAPARPGEVRAISLDCRLIRHTLAWEPMTTFKEGLRKTAEHFRQMRAPA